MELIDLINSNNLAEELSDDILAELSVQVRDHYDSDVDSRVDWEDAYTKWLDMTGQKVEHKTKPWPGAANIKFPLMTQAALQFNARALPALVPNNEPVGAGVVGPDPTGDKGKIARAVARHMNYQVITEMSEWEEEFDSMLMAIPVSGMEYKKIYFDHQLGRNVSRHVTPLNLVVNYYAKDLASTRKTEVHRWTRNRIIEGIADGSFADIDWEAHPDPLTGKESEVEVDNAARNGREEPSVADSATPYTVLEYHGWADLDEDGYEEPYIITMIEESMQILQVIPRFGEESVTFNDNNEVSRIVAYESYVKFGFIPNPDGSFYDIGFGNLLYPINAVVNTSINMMLDAGASSIMNSGFVGRGIKMRGGMFTMAPNTWMSVNGSGDDIRKSFVPMPTKEPSSVLLALMQYMVEAGQKLSSTTDVFTGEMPGQNTKTGVTQTIRDEGQKVFNAIYKRIRRGVKRELDLIYELNGIILSAGEGAAGTKVAQSAQVFGIHPEMYSKELMNIQPSADPNTAIKEQRLQKDLGVYQIVSESGIGDKAEAQRRVLDTMETENLDAIQPEGAQAAQDPAVAMAASQADFDAEMAKNEFALKVWQAEMQAKLELARIAAQSDQAAAQLGISQAELQFEVESSIEDRNERDRATQANPGSMGGMEG